MALFPREINLVKLTLDLKWSLTYIIYRGASKNPQISIIIGMILLKLSALNMLNDEF